MVYLFKMVDLSMAVLVITRWVLFSPSPHVIPILNPEESQSLMAVDGKNP
jgi:hypothetical protein